MKKILVIVSSASCLMASPLAFGNEQPRTPLDLNAVEQPQFNRLLALSHQLATSTQLLVREVLPYGYPLQNDAIELQTRCQNLLKVLQSNEDLGNEYQEIEPALNKFHDEFRKIQGHERFPSIERQIKLVHQFYEAMGRLL